MKRALNFAVLKHFTQVEEASAEDVIEVLKDDYGDYKMLNKKAIYEILLTGEVNGFLQESRFELDANGQLRVYYKAHQEGRDTINKYLP
ncbi:MAG: hypothetical protein FWG63_09030 [Defluviitaleaceae bacterium]|nr:hypothetical protein [Defluviitaleaceae bacterium]